MHPEVDLPAIERLFQDIRASLPHLDIRTVDDPEIDLGVHLPRQNGLSFDVAINLQNDELHLGAGEAFWVEWFPCTDPAVVASFRAAVLGLLSGEYRILETRRSRRVVKAQLQRPEGDHWRTIAKWARPHLPLPWRTTQAVLRNTRATA